MTSIPIEDDVAVCPTCFRLVTVDWLCECDDNEFGPLCDRCCRAYHQDERRAA